MVVTNESWFIVRNTPNVTWFLWAWNIPVPVSEEEFNQLKWTIEKNSSLYASKFKLWDTITITKWTFEWNNWQIIEINDKKWYVKVNINILWRDTPVELDFSQVKIRL